jgi:hypothetical protein
LNRGFPSGNGVHAKEFSNLISDFLHGAYG